MTSLVLDIGAVAAGGACVARADDGRVVFVRHTLPGERVRAVITSETKHFLRADAVEVLTASPDRVAAPCPFSGPGRCGGCDWQHASLPAQRALKAAAVAEQLQRVAGLTISVDVEEVPGTPDGLGWRTRVQWAVSASGALGLHKHRSNELELVSTCLIAAPGVEEPLGEDWSGARSVEAFSVAGQTVLTVDGRPRAIPEVNAGLVIDGRPVKGPHGIRTWVAGRSFEVAAGGFWQVHPSAAEVLAAAVMDLLAPAPGETAADLYAGVGLFASLIGAAVGPTGSVVAIESELRACADASRNTADQPWVKVRTAAVTPSLVGSLRQVRPVYAPAAVAPGSVPDAASAEVPAPDAGAASTPVPAPRQVIGRASVGPDLVVLDPPRAGAGVEVAAALVALHPRAIAYVACDAASFARDLKVFLDAGWTMPSLRAFDIYPMTEHVELVALLTPPA